MRETELKAAVPDEEACLQRLLAAGARQVSEGRLEDRRYDYPDRRLTMHDVVLRLRVTRNSSGTAATLDLKGAATYEAGYKHREETSVPIGNAGQMAGILTALGYVVTRAIDRDVRLLQLGRATLRFERFARMDTLLEVEGPEEAIEAAIAASGLPRASFTPDRLYMFVQRFEARTGQRAAICDDESSGSYPFSLEDA
jgi:predicted adenylyl cyclase CyaB